MLSCVVSALRDAEIESTPTDILILRIGDIFYIHNHFSDDI